MLDAYGKVVKKEKLRRLHALGRWRLLARRSVQAEKVSKRWAILIRGLYAKGNTDLQLNYFNIENIKAMGSKK